MPVYKVISCEISKPSLLTAESVSLWREQGVEQEKPSEPMPGQNSMPMGASYSSVTPPLEPAQKGLVDYVHGQADAALLHSRAGVDLARWEEAQKKRTLKDLYTTGEEEDAGDGSDNEIAKKLESFKAWGREVSVCTVDTVLGLLQCNRRPIYCFPAIANAAFVFDEVHCYDDKLFWCLAEISGNG